jgi:hypothetical protein
MHPRVCVSGLCFPGLPAIDAIGHHAAAAQTANWLDKLLEELGA